jgi:hypothetical protein
LREGFLNFKLPWSPKLQEILQEFKPDVVVPPAYLLATSFKKPERLISKLEVKK